MSSNSDARKILTDINKRNISPIYLLYGDESYFIDIIVDALNEKAIAPEDRDFNFNQYYGHETNVDTVVNCAQQFPVFADRKLVILKEAQAMDKAKTELDKFIPYVAHLNPSSTLVVTYKSKNDKFSAVSALEKAVKKAGGVVLKSTVPKDYELPTYVKDFCRDRKVGIEDNAVQMLCEYIGTPLSKLFGELNKLILITADTKRITASDVERHIGVSKDYNNFELKSAVCRRDYPRCMAIVNYFRINSKANPTVLTVGTLFNYFSKLLIAHFLPVKDDVSLSNVLGSPYSKALQEFKAALKAYPPAHTVKAIHAIREFDSKNKGVNSFANEYDLLQELIFKIMT